MIVGLIAGALVGYWAVTKFRSPKTKYFLACEYWVYLPEEKAPPQDAVMNEMIRDNPYRVAGQAAIGPKEGLVFSDIRLHVALVLRSKNPHVFRPDLFDENVQPTADDLQALADSRSLQKIRFLSEEPVRDHRHLQFLPHMAMAVAKLGGSRIIFDATGERLISVAALDEQLREDGDASKPSLHLRIVWRNQAGAGIAETRGLLKVGVPEIATEATDVDERVLVTAVLEEAANRIWESKTMPATLTVEAFQDMFEIQLTPTSKGPYRARIFRTQPA